MRNTMNTYVLGHNHNGGTTLTDMAFDEDFCTVGARWVPNGINWFWDSKKDHPTRPDSTLLNHLQKLYISLWRAATLTNLVGHRETQNSPLACGSD